MRKYPPYSSLNDSHLFAFSGDVTTIGARPVQGDTSGQLKALVELGLESFGSCWAATVATNYPTAQTRWQN